MWAPSSLPQPEGKRKRDGRWTHAHQACASSSVGEGDLVVVLKCGEDSVAESRREAVGGRKKERGTLLNLSMEGKIKD